VTVDSLHGTYFRCFSAGQLTARYRGKGREIVIEVFPELAAVRLWGARTRYEVSWRSVFDMAAEIYSRRIATVIDNPEVGSCGFTTARTKNPSCINIPRAGGVPHGKSLPPHHARRQNSGARLEGWRCPVDSGRAH
jgi:hypothetical protein